MHDLLQAFETGIARSKERPQALNLLAMTRVEVVLVAPPGRSLQGKAPLHQTACSCMGVG
eukprot:4227694-Alexandrium_andersonii.AAC.1